MKGDRDFPLGEHMKHTENNATSHLDSAKEELKSAAVVVAEEAKEKVESVVASLAVKVGEVADQIEQKTNK